MARKARARDGRPPLTERQARVLAIIRRFTAERGFPPTIRDLCGEYGCKGQSMRQHLKLIEKKGYIARTPGTARSIAVVGACCLAKV